MYGKGLRALSLATFAALTATFALVFFYAPLDADQGFIQKIFYVHVPVAIVTLCSYVAIHIALIFNVLGLLTGAIWAKASWGHWWVWDEPTLVSYLIVFLLFATYQPLRFSIEDPERQARYASVFAIMAGAFVPLNFIAVRAATAYVHPRVLATSEGGMPGQMALTFLIAIVAMTLLFALLCSYEIAAKQTRWQLRALRRRLLGGDAVAPLGRSAAPSLGGPAPRGPAARASRSPAEVAS